MIAEGKVRFERLPATGTRTLRGPSSGEAPVTREDPYQSERHGEYAYREKERASDGHVRLQGVRLLLGPLPGESPQEEEETDPDEEYAGHYRYPGYDRGGPSYPGFLHP